MTIEFLGKDPVHSRPSSAPLPMLVSAVLGFLLGIALLIAIRPAINEPYDVNPVAAPSGPLSGVERGRQADAARLEALADRWVSDNCGHTDPPKR
jgi:hypothetical protein